MLIKGAVSQAYLVAFATGLALNLGLFNVSHFLIANKYQRMTTEIPAQILGNKDKPRERSKIVFWTLLAFSVFGPMLQAFCGYRLRKVILAGGQPTDELSTFASTSYVCTGASQTLSGVMLVSSVYKIKKFFRENNAEDCINTAMLWRHALSFGLFLASSVMFFSMLCLFSWFPANKKIENAFYISQSLYMIASTISQFLLCQIFWRLGRKHTPTHEAVPERPDFDIDFAI